MRAPKGFGKRYFTLSAVQAYSGGITLHRVESSARAHHRMVSDECDDEDGIEEDDAPTPENVAAALPGGRRRPCLCNLHFHRLSCARLHSHRRPKRFQSPYRYSRSTLSPPPLVSHCRRIIHFPKESLV